MGMPDKMVLAIVERIETLAVGRVMRRRTFCRLICSAGAGARRTPMRFRPAAVALADRHAGNRATFAAKSDSNALCQ